MTEQEKREMAIAKMIKGSEKNETDVTLEQLADIVRKGGFAGFARAYDAGYRKANEVRMETAKEMYETVERLLLNNFSNDAILYTLKQKYLTGNDTVTNNNYIEGKKDGVKQALTELVKLARWEDGLNTVSIRQLKEKAKEFGVEIEENN